MRKNEEKLKRLERAKLRDREKETSECTIKHDHKTLFHINTLSTIRFRCLNTHTGRLTNEQNRKKPEARMRDNENVKQFGVRVRQTVLSN